MLDFSSTSKNAKSITVDQCREFAKYHEIEEKLCIPMYFAHSCSPDEHGSNEVLYRYVRTFIPKEQNIEVISQKELDQIKLLVNARSIKTLNWQSPQKGFQQHVVFG